MKKMYAGAAAALILMAAQASAQGSRDVMLFPTAMTAQVGAPQAGAQSVYVRAGIGYSFSAGSELDYGTTESTYDGSTSENKWSTPISTSLGKGMNTVLAVGYMVNQYVGVELGAGYLIGVTKSATYKSTPSDTTIASAAESTTNIKGSTLTLTPSLRITAPLGNNMGLYSRVGVILPLVNNAKMEWKSNSTTETYDAKVFFHIGYSTALGMELSLTNNMSLFSEINAAFLRFDIKETTTKNDEDNETKTEFSKEISKDKSSVGFTLGLSFKF